MKNIEIKIAGAAVLIIGGTLLIMKEEGLALTSAVFIWGAYEKYMSYQKGKMIKKKTGFTFKELNK